MKALNIAMTSVVALLLSVAVRAELVSTAGGLGVYDTVNNVTWTSDGNLFATQAASYSGGYSAFVAAVISATPGGVIYDTANFFIAMPNSRSNTLSESDFKIQGDMTWFGARAWVNYLNATNYAGTNTWALPTTVDLFASGGYPDGASDRFPQSSSQMAQLFYGGLGQVAGSDITTIHNSSYALFSQLQSYYYWSGAEYLRDFHSEGYPLNAWYFSTFDGFQFSIGKRADNYALAVSPGQVGALSAVPVPGAAWLLGSGLLGLAGLRRKGKQS